MPFVGSSSAKTTEVQKAQPKNARECHEGLKLLNLLNLNGDMAMLSISVPLDVHQNGLCKKSHTSCSFAHLISFDHLLVDRFEKLTATLIY